MILPQKIASRGGFKGNPYKARNVMGDYRRRNFFALIALCFTLAIWGLVVLFLPYFRVNKITYLGLSLIKKNDIDGFVRGELLKDKWIIPYNNYFFISSKTMKKEMMAKYSLNYVEIKKIFPDQIRIDLEEKISTVIYDNGKNYYLLDSEGNVNKFLFTTDNPEQNITTNTLDYYDAQRASSTIFSASSSTSTPNLSIQKTHIPEYRKLRRDFGPFPILYDMRNLSTDEGDENILRDDYITALIRWSEELDKQGISSVRYMTTEHPLSGVAIYTNEPWIVYVQPENYFDQQMTNLKAILRDNLPNEYIDLRYGNRVYWK